MTTSIIMTMSITIIMTMSITITTTTITPTAMQRAVAAVPLATP